MSSKIAVSFPYSFNIIIDDSKFIQLMEILNSADSYEKNYVNGKYEFKIKELEEFPDIEIISEREYNVMKFVTKNTTE